MDNRAELTPNLYIDESPHLDSKLEWWYVHGWFSTGKMEERHFMVSLFRHRLAGPINVFVALISILDPRTGRLWTSSRVDRRILDAIRLPGVIRSLDPFSAPVIHDELRSYGLPREFECPDSAPVLSGNPLRFEWADLTLTGHPESIALAFEEPGESRPLRLVLRSETPRLTLDAARSVAEPENDMQYVTYPKMHLSGSRDGVAVEGEAWFDHQWGGFAMLQSPNSPPQIRGWDWLGCWLDDGSSWLAMVRWEGLSGKTSSRHLTTLDHSGNVRTIGTFEWEPVRWWSSPASRVRHPVEWRLRVPEWEAELVFTPIADHQEVRVFSPLRVIWQGAGRVRGHVRGRPVEGLARLEGQGRGYVLSSSDYLRGWTEFVDRELAQSLPQVTQEPDIHRGAGPPARSCDPSSDTNIPAEPPRDLMERGRVRWRAIFLYLLLDMLGRDPEPLRDIALVLPELLHHTSLIIDHAQDGDGNAALSAPLRLVAEHPTLPAEHKRGVCETLQTAFSRIQAGQSLDLRWSRNLNPTQLDAWMADSFGAKILQMYALRTASLIEGMADAAALLAGSDENTRHAVLRFARSFGLAFQLLDDVKNFTGAPVGDDSTGSDLRDGKLTYLIFRALKRLAPPERSVLRDILCQSDLRCDANAVNRGIELIVGSGACTRVSAEARTYVAPAWEALSRIVPASSSKTELRFLWESLLASSP